MKLEIAPSILAADFARLGEQVAAVEAAGVEQIHIDVMDGHFVPNLSMGPLVVRALDRITELPLDVHLMITDPGDYLEPFVEAGADHISFHVEAEGDSRAMLEWLQERGVGRGIAVNPETTVENVIELLPVVDRVLVMTVHPGFGGQAFLTANLEKVRKVREEEEKLRREPGSDRTLKDWKLDVQVDGGIDRDTITASRDAGANVFVAGSSIFSAADPGDAVRDLRTCLEAGLSPRS